MRPRVGIPRLAALALSLAFIGCKESTGPKNPQLQDATTAKWFAWHVVDVIGIAAPNGSSSATWNNTVVSGLVSGTATVNGSFTYSYNGTGPSVRTYNNVTIQFNKFCYDSYSGACVTGTISVNGSCSTTYGFSSATYTGYWAVSGTAISVSSSYVEGQASIAMQMYNDPSRIFAAYVMAGSDTWPVSEP